MREHPHQPLSKVFLDGVGRGGGPHRAWAPVRVAASPLPEAFPGPSLCRAAGLLLPKGPREPYFLCTTVSSVNPISPLSEWQINSLASTYTLITLVLSVSEMEGREAKGRPRSTHNTFGQLFTGWLAFGLASVPSPPRGASTPWLLRP